MPVNFNEVPANPDPVVPQRPNGPLGQTAASDLTSLAERAQRRQEAITAQPGSANSLFPIQGAPGALPNLLGGRGSGQVQNIPGITNPVPNAAVESLMGQQETDRVVAQAVADVLPTRAPAGLEAEPVDTPYVDLSPTQRNSSMRRIKMDVTNYISDPETRAPRRSRSGASILSVKPEGFDEELYLAEDGMAAQSALVQAVRRSGISAQVRRVEDGDIGYTTEWNVAPQDRVKFARLLAYLEVSDVQATASGGRVTFDANHAMNRAHMQAPFGQSQKGRR